MDYMVQTEKIFKYLDLNIEIEDKITISKIKQIFNNDLNLFGCFIKDFLMIKNPNKTIEDECLYNDFVLYFENVITKKEIKKELLEIYNFGKYYLTIVFEDTNDIELQNTILIVNSCFALDSYPYLMILQDKYKKKEINKNSYILMLQSISDVILKTFENPNNLSIKFNETDIAKKISNTKERLVS